MHAAAVVLPEFALLALGLLLRLRFWRAPGFWVDLERLVYFVLFPVLLFRTTLAADLGTAGTGAVLLAAVGGTLAGAVLGSVVFVLPGGRTAAASGWQTAFRFNSFLALALADDGGPAALALMGVLLGVNVPLVNVLAVTALARATASGAGRRRGRVPAAVARNPLVLATAAGLAGNAAGLALPGLLDTTLARLASAAVPLGLLAVGAALRMAGLPRDRWPAAASLAVVKLLAVPTVALGLAAALGVGRPGAAVVLAFAAVPPATSSYVLAARMGGDGPFVAAQTSLTTAAALVTLPLWLALTG
ncbi:AEC family transporter [Geodermatophilus sp. YIM 151500]|uniref:AEC family transporter n=1 Tax=Geodermatophilus sp. YIM 151500 TaxID=2984531 RepID=UPI0021E3F5E4|nr:AEC family transporter [Geodermatophilus sp. YIM 151500]MCV2489904.1 AEC family transporter [Geodermatophilus sp. YIM 151500]